MRYRELQEIKRRHAEAEDAYKEVDAHDKREKKKLPTLLQSWEYGMHKDRGLLLRELEEHKVVLGRCRKLLLRYKGRKDKPLCKEAEDLIIEIGDILQ